jgi:UrcA family protein
MIVNAFVKTIAGFSLAISLAATAQAQSSIQVDVSDLDLANAKDQRALALRINRAARAVCISEAVRQDPAIIRAERRCVEATARSVQRQVAAKAGVRAAAD